jgi:SAM-dependent methyltransferase
MKRLHGKPLDKDFINVKSNYLPSNSRFLAKTLEDAHFLLNQPEVPNCIVCGSVYNLNTGETFSRHNLLYYICNTCGHFNCTRHATAEYAKYMYADTDYTEVTYSQAFSSQQALTQRLNSIDRPKVKMILEELLPGGPESYIHSGWLDIGCGSGFTLLALSEYGLKNLRGIDYSSQQLANARSILPASIDLKEVNNDTLLEYIDGASARVHSMIGVLEHVLDPNLVIKSISQNTRCEILLVSVPTFSLSTFVELAGHKTWARQLSSSHTHLFTDTSLTYLLKSHGFTPYSSWHYGQDAYDLIRMLAIESSSNSLSTAHIINKLTPLIQPLQQLVDDLELSSELLYVFVR